MDKKTQKILRIFNETFYLDFVEKSRKIVEKIYSSFMVLKRTSLLLLVGISVISAALSIVFLPFSDLLITSSSSLKRFVFIAIVAISHVLPKKKFEGPPQV